jgi:LysR family hydrogen peroxide-inducible transcriptional activator
LNFTTNYNEVCAMMNCRTLEYVVAVKEEGSLQLAAYRCNASPSTVSSQITRLENYLGVRIFEQRAHPATLSAKGIELFPLIADAWQKIRQLRDLARSGE